MKMASFNKFIIHFCFFFYEIPVHVFCPLLKIKLFVIIILIFRSSLPIRDSNPLSVVINGKYCHLFGDLSFYSFKF